MSKGEVSEAQGRAPWEKNGTEYDESLAKRKILALEGDLREARKDASGLREDLAAARAAHEKELDVLRGELREVQSDFRNDPALVLERDRLTVALEEGLTAQQASFLQGGDVDAMRESVKGLRDAFATPVPAPVSSVSYGMAHGNESRQRGASFTRKDADAMLDKLGY